MADWMLIETAPKDGRWILVCMIARHRDDQTALYDIVKFDGGRWVSALQVPVASKPSFAGLTHWQPLPPPPTEDR